MKNFVIIFFALFVCGDGLTKELSDVEKQLIEKSDSLVAESISFLEKIVNINSGTKNTNGVKQVGLVLKKEFDRLGMNTQWINIPSRDRGGHLFASTVSSSGPGILIISHIDTIFRKSSSFQKFQRTGNMGVGPGVNDAKGGIVVILAALKALKAIGILDQMKITVALMGDEEMAAIDSEGRPLRKHLINAAKNADIALGFEYAVESINKATIARRGHLSWTIEVSGAGGHSSKIFSKGVGDGVVFSAAYILDKIRKKFRRQRYLTINPGLMIGGTSVELPPYGIEGTGFGKNNVMAKKVTITGDIRTISSEQLEAVKEGLHKIVSNPLEHTTATIHFDDNGESPPMSPTPSNRKLLKLLSQVSEDLGYGKVAALDPGLRGTADIAFVAPHIKAGIDGLGALGAGAHSEKESIDLNTIPQLINRTSLFLYRLVHFSVD